MNEKILLKNGKEYPLVIGGTSSTPRTLQLIFQAAEPLEDIVALFADAAATEQIKTVNEDGSTLAVYGRVALLTLSQPSVEAAVEHNRADIDFLAVMTGTDL